MMNNTTARRTPNHADREACWEPANWHAQQINAQHWLLTNMIAPVEFELWDHGNGDYTVRGHSGELHTLVLGCCSPACKGKAAAMAANRYDPHEACVVAVERVKDDEGARREWEFEPCEVTL